MRQPVPFGKYLLLDRVSVGGMAEVFKAKSFGVEGFEKVIAIKRILPSMGEDEDFIKMFIDEAKIAGQLAHANIGQIHELGQFDGSHFIAMEYIWGRDLLQIQNRFKKVGKKLSHVMASYVVMKICEGLHYAHKKRDVLGQPMNIVHRDCSPQNVLISFEGEVKLIDFGIAKAASRSSKTNAGVLKGKFGYMSPEQVRGLPLDRRSDIFSLGTILFECLTGQRLFQGESDFSTLERVRNAEISRPMLAKAAVPPAVEKVVLKALARNADDRYQWASEMRDDLRAFLQTQPDVYTNRNLGEELRAVFTQELERERALMDKYRKIGRDGVMVGGSSEAESLLGGASALAQAASLLDSGEVKPLARGTGKTGGEDQFEDRPTEIFGEIGLDALQTADEADPIHRAETEAPNREGSSEDKVLVEEALSADEMSAGDAAASRAKGFEVKSKPGTGSTTNDMGSVLDGTLTPVPLEHSSRAPVAIGPDGTLAQPTGSGTGVRRPPSKARKGQRDMVVGFAIVATLLVLAVGAKLFFFSGDGDKGKAPTGTLVVLVDDKEAAKVWLGDKDMGQVPAGQPLTLEALEPGTYELKIERDGVDPCTKTVELTADKVEVFNCEFAQEALAHLLLDELEPEDHVVVDGREITGPELAKGIALEPGRNHSVAVSREGSILESFEVNLAKGEEKHHSLPSAAAEMTFDENESGDGNDDGDSKDDERKVARDDASESSSSPRRNDEGRDSKEDESPNKRPPRNDAPIAKERKPKPDPKADEPEIDPNADGYFIAFTKPWARVIIDGKDTGKVTPIAPAAKIPLKPGTHKVTFVVGEEKHTFSFKINPGKLTRMAKQFQ